MAATHEKSKVFDLRGYVLLICSTAVLITAAGIYLLYQQIRHDEDLLARSHRARISESAGMLQDAVRDGGSDLASRISALSACVEKGRYGSPSAAFIWNPKDHVVWSSGLTEPLSARISSFSHWAEWTSPAVKNPRRGLMELEDGAGRKWFVLWGRVDASLYALVYDAQPIVRDDGSLLWPVGVCLGFLLCGVLGVFSIMLGRAARRAREDDVRKTAFVSNASHELKTPLAAIRIWTEMLSSGRLKTDERRQHALDVIAEENGRMIRLVDNLLDFSRLEGKRKRYSLVGLDVTALAREAVEFMSGAFSANGISCSASVAVRAVADVDAVKQILVNLIGNAAKYAAADGPVEVSVGVAGGVVRVEVADRGPGMAPDELGRAFERFYRAGGADSSGTGGLGLGLSISRALARDMGGDIAARVREGGGLVFTLSLPEAD